MVRNNWKALLLSSLMLGAFSGMCGEYVQGGDTWYYEENSDGTVTIMGHGPKDSSNIVIPSSINGKAVTIIGADAFQGRENLASVTIPDSVTVIGSFAFQGCKSLTNITFPDSITTIYNDAFCFSGLTSVTIPNNVTYIDPDAFSNCQNLRDFIVADDNSKYKSINGFLLADDGRTVVCEPVDQGRDSIIFPDGVTGIGPFAFASRENLTSVTIPDTVTSIGEYAFRQCVNLTNVSIPNSVTNIGACAFGWCESLMSVTIPDSAIIDSMVFEGCGLVAPEFADENGFVIVNNRLLYYYWGCGEKAVIPDGVTRIEGCAFYRHDELTSVIIPSSVISIGSHAFDYCSGIRSITIPSSVASIGDCAFYGCRSLTSVEFANPDTVIDWTAFRDCTNLSSIKMTSQSYTQTGWKLTFDTPAYASSPNNTYSTVKETAYMRRNAEDETGGDEGGITGGGETGGGRGSDTGIDEGGAVSGGNSNVWNALVYDVGDTLTFPVDDLSFLSGINITNEDGKVIGIVRGEGGKFDPHVFVGGGSGNRNRAKFSAIWEKNTTPEIFVEEQTDAFAGNAQYTGWLRDAEGNLVGTITVKAGKPNAKTKVSKVTATVIELATGKKLSYSGTATAGALANVTLSGKSGKLNVTLSDDSVSGDLGNGLSVEAAKNVFTSKDSGDKSAAASVPKKTWTVTLTSVKGYTPFTIAIAAKGKAKVTGVLPDGTKVSVSAQAVVGDGGRWAVPVMFAKKSKFGFVAWFDANGFTTVSDLTPLKGPKGAVTEWEAALDACGPVGSLAAGAHAFAVDAESVVALLPAVNAELLPTAEEVKVAGNKWTLAKAAKVAYKGGAWTVTPGAKGGAVANASGAKLTFTPKTGTFKGSFTAYSVKGGRLVKTKFTVNGAVVNGVAYGTAFNKTAGSVPLTVQ